MTRLLVVYATKHGSTQQVAEAIGAAVADEADVRLLRAGERRELPAGADVIVLGAPLYSGRWHRDAHRFLKRHRTELGPTPLAVFGMGPREDDPQAWRRSRAQLDRALAKHAWLVPAAVALFGGADPAGRAHGERHDLRDWTVIEGWARKLPGLATGGD
jgi:menaquinone-dependent protoporphyrinogen oxidase